MQALRITYEVLLRRYLMVTVERTAARFAEQHLLANLLREESFLTAPAEALVRVHALPAMCELMTHFCSMLGPVDAVLVSVIGTSDKCKYDPIIL